LTSLDLQHLDPLLGGCGGPTSVGHDGRHSAIALPTHPWEGGPGGEIDQGVWLAPPNSAWSSALEPCETRSVYYATFNGSFLISCPRILEIVEPALAAGLPRAKGSKGLECRGDRRRCRPVERRRS
jgi:hypothetical protein